VDKKAQKNDRGGVSVMKDSLFDFLDISSSSSPGLSPHEHALLDFVRWLDQPRDRPPFSWLSTFEGFSVQFGIEGADLLRELANCARAILERNKLIEQEKACWCHSTGRKGGADDG